MTNRPVSPPRRRAVVALAALFAPALAAPEQAPATAGAPAGEDAISADLLRTGLFLISGGGCQSLLRLNAAGCVLVDGKRAGTYRPLMSLVRRINKLSDLPLRGVIYTNHHDIHAGNHPQFVAGGVSVLVQSNALPRLPSLPPLDAAAASGPRHKRPQGVVGGFDRAHRFTMGGVEVRLRHFGPAQTDNDAVVLFPDLKVLAAGELLSPELPMPDYAAGGSLLGWRAVLDQLSDLEFDTVVSSAGAPVARNAVRDFSRRVGILVDRAASLVKDNVPKGDFTARLRTDDLGWHRSMSEQEVDLLYRDLLQTR